MINVAAFRSYDIRGITLQDFDTRGAFAIGRAFTCFIREQCKRTRARIVVQRDARAYSEELMHAAIRGATSVGADVIDGGESTTPMHYFSVRAANADGGMMITASHNPPQYNGFKLSGEQAHPIGMGSGLEYIRDMALGTTNMRQADGSEGGVFAHDFREAYVQELHRIVQPRARMRMCIVSDTSNGMAGLVIRDILRPFTALEVHYVNETINMAAPVHSADPMLPEGVREAQTRVRRSGAELGIVFDGDGDRVGFIDEHGDTVPSEAIAALIAMRLLEHEKDGAVVYSVASSRMLPDAVRDAGGKAHVERVGHTFIKTRMELEHAVFGAEPSGHFYYRALGYAEGAMLTVLYILALLHESGHALSEITAPFRTSYASLPQIRIPMDAHDMLMRVKTYFADARISEIDGVSVDAGAFWFNIRPSNTEQVTRLNLEARDSMALAIGKRAIEEALGISLDGR